MNDIDWKRWTESVEALDVGEPVLCYVDGPWAYFTTQPLQDQWGDDWNDAPYEHNAGEPYGFSDCDARSGKQPWEIHRVAFFGPFDPPCEGHRNSPWSVQDINRGVTPWVQLSRWVERDANVSRAAQIMAGTTISEFCRRIIKAGGEVYVKKVMP